MSRRVVIVCCVLVAAITGALGIGVGVAVAHSGLAAASPGPGAVVGGTVDEVQIFYADFITTFDGTVTSPSGDVLASTAEMTSDIEAVITLEQPLSEPGEYAVRHTITALDDDVVEAAYLFTYDPAAAPPRVVFVEPEEESATSWILWIVVGVGVVVIAVLSWRLVAAVKRRNAGAATNAG